MRHFDRECRHIKKNGFMSVLPLEEKGFIERGRNEKGRWKIIQ